MDAALVVGQRVNSRSSPPSVEMGDWPCHEGVLLLLPIEPVWVKEHWTLRFLQ